MEFQNCILVKTTNSTEKSKLTNTLHIAKTVMSMTTNMPTLNWQEVNIGGENKILISGIEPELKIVKLTLTAVLGVNFNSAPFQVEYGFRFPESQETGANNAAQPTSQPVIPVEQSTTLRTAVAAVEFDEDEPLLNLDASVQQYNETGPATFIAGTTNVVTADTSGFTVPLDEEIPFDLSHSANSGVAASNWSDDNLDSAEDWDTVINNTPEGTRLNPDGAPDYLSRARWADYDREIVSVWHGRDDVSEQQRVNWNLAFNRFADEPNPTVSNSGTISREAQLTFDDAHNPRRWNLVKCRYSVGGYYLTYLCPPSVDMQTTLAIQGGVHANDTPEILDICVWNTEPYWRELRHLMHNPEVHYLREALVA